MSNERTQKSTTTMNNESPDLAQREKKLVATLANVKTDAVQLNDTGWTSRVYIVEGGRFVFKFPRKEEVKQEYVQEIKAYQMLEKISSHIQVPVVRWTDQNNDYFGYEGVVGNELTAKLATLDDTQKTVLGQAIGEFLKQLHSLTLEEPHAMSIDDEIKQAQEKYAGCQGILSQHFNAEEITKLNAFFDQTMPETMRNLGEDPALCHGDLGYWNMVLKADGTLGLIDFGDIGHYDRAKDFCGLADSTMLEAALSVYGGNSDLLRQKVAIRQQYLPLFDLQYFSASGNEAEISKTVESIRSKLL